MTPPPPRAKEAAPRKGNGYPCKRVEVRPQHPAFTVTSSPNQTSQLGARCPKASGQGPREEKRKDSSVNQVLSAAPRSWVPDAAESGSAFFGHKRALLADLGNPVC